MKVMFLKLTTEIDEGCSSFTISQGCQMRSSSAREQSCGKERNLISTQTELEHFITWTQERGMDDVSEQTAAPACLKVRGKQ